MIGFLSGEVYSKSTDSIILLVGGVGYQVFLPINFLTSLEINSKINVFIKTHVKEDAIELYGFKNLEEIEMFKLLNTVSGIGAKTALLVLDHGVDKIKGAIEKANVDFFLTVPRLGKKNSQRIIIDLKNKVGSLTDLDLGGSSTQTQEVSEALESMGYKTGEIQKALKQIPDSASSIEEKIRVALRSLSKV